MCRWVCLLYDLVIVAVLMVFSYFHQISSRSAAARFFSFFVLMVRRHLSLSNLYRD